MSQHSMVIADGSGEELLQACNGSVQALASCNTGPNAPATIYPHMLWPDETAGVLKIRNKANTAWIIIGKFDENNGLFIPYFGGGPIVQQQLIPAGAILPFPVETPPGGFLECSGASLSRATYSSLFAAIGTTFGAADGNSFTLPNLRGAFVRGWDHGRGLDPDRASRSNRGDGIGGDRVGTGQADQFKSHVHSAGRDYVTSTETGMSQGVATGPYLSHDPPPATGGNETRPWNINLMYCIRY